MATPFSLSGSLADVFANRPAPSADKAGRFFLATDTGQLYRDTGAAWLPVRDALTDRPRSGPLIVQSNDQHALQVLAVTEGEPGELIEVFNVDTLTRVVTLLALATASTEVVANLNAEKVGDHPAEDFAAAGHTHASQLLSTIDGVCSVRAGKHRIYNRLGRTVTLSEIFLAIDTPPVGAALIVSVAMNGESIGAIASIAAGAHTGLTEISTQWPHGSYLTANVDQVGSSTPGSDLVVHAAYQ